MTSPWLKVLPMTKALTGCSWKSRPDALCFGSSALSAMFMDVCQFYIKYRPVKHSHGDGQ